MGNNTATKLNELRDRAEQVLRESSKGLKNIPTEDIQNLIHKLKVYQIELEMQFVNYVLNVFARNVFETLRTFTEQLFRPISQFV